MPEFRSSMWWNDERDRDQWCSWSGNDADEMEKSFVPTYICGWCFIPWTLFSRANVCEWSAGLTPIGCKQARGRSNSWWLMSLFSSLSLAPYWRDSSSAKQTSYGTDKVFRRGAYSTPTMLTRRGAEYVQQADMSKYWGLWTGLRPGEFFTLTFLVLLVSFSSSYKILAAPTTCTLEWLVY